MTHRIAMVILTGCGLALAAHRPKAPPPKLIGIYRAGADPALPPLPHGFLYRVNTIAFSPDERFVSVALVARPKDRSAPPKDGSTVLLLPLPPAGGREVEIHSDTQSAVLWSPDSKSVVVRSRVGGQLVPKMYNLRGEPVWTGPPSGPPIGFIGPERLLAWQPWKRRTTQFDIVDIRTSAVTPFPWRPPRRHEVVDAIASDRGLVAVRLASEIPKILTVESATGKAVQSLKNQNGNGGYDMSLYPFDIGTRNGNRDSITSADSFDTGNLDLAYFAEGGKTLCDAAMRGAFQTRPLCQDVNTGRTIAEFRGIEGGQLADVSALGSRMILTKTNTGHLVWDFRAGAVVADWGPPSKKTAWPGKTFTDLFAPIAISPLGNYVAEALGDEVHIYRLP